MKAPSPAFSYYPKDIDSDENCKAMDLTEFGAYSRLMGLAWTEGSIPADPTRLSKILGVSRKAFDRLWPAVSPCWTPHGDRLIQLRLEKERAKQAQRSRENADNGRNGGRPRKSNDSAKNEKRTVIPQEPNGLGIETETKGRAGASSPSPSPSPSSVSTEQEPTSSSVDSKPETTTDADVAREELRNAIEDLRKRLPGIAGGSDQAILNATPFHSSGGGICRIETCTNPGLMRATAAKVRAYGKPKARAAPAWDLGISSYTAEEITEWDPRLGPRPTNLQLPESSGT